MTPAARKNTPGRLSTSPPGVFSVNRESAARLHIISGKQRPQPSPKSFQPSQMQSLPFPAPFCAIRKLFFQRLFEPAETVSRRAVCNSLNFCFWNSFRQCFSRPPGADQPGARCRRQRASKPAENDPIYNYTRARVARPKISPVSPASSSAFPNRISALLSQWRTVLSGAPIRAEIPPQLYPLI